MTITKLSFVLAAVLTSVFVGSPAIIPPSQTPPSAKVPAGASLPPGAKARLGDSNWRHSSVVCFAAFLPDGKSVLTADDETIRVWEWPSGKGLRRIDLPFPADPAFRTTNATPAGAKLLVYSMPVALSNDGKTVACYFDKKAILCYEVATGKMSGLGFPTGPSPGVALFTRSLFRRMGKNLPLSMHRATFKSGIGAKGGNSGAWARIPWGCRAYPQAPI